MSNLDSNLNSDDLETLLEATNDWEMLGNNDFYTLNMVKTVPLPAEDHETYRFISHIKEHFRSREKDIKAARAVRQEKAVFLKAKLMMLKRDLGITQLFDEAQVVPERGFVMKASADHTIKLSDDEIQRAEDLTNAIDKDLKRAEEFIKDLGVWEHYQKFCLERTTK